MLNNLTVPDYVSLLHLCGQETEFPLIPACLITYFHFRCSGSVSVPLGQTWGQRWVKEQCTTSAVSARFKRLAVKYGSWLKLMDGNLMLSGAIPISKPQTIVHKLNQTIVLLCLERLETCLPAEYATAHATDSGDGDKIPSDQINLYHAKTVEHQRLLKVTKDILYQQYVTRRSHLSEQLKELDSTWNTPLTKLAAELELELQNWTVDGNAATTTTKTARKPRQRMLQGATNEEKQSDLTSSIRTHIRNVWQQGTEHAKQRVIEGQLTSEHVSLRFGMSFSMQRCKLTHKTQNAGPCSHSRTGFGPSIQG